MTYKKIGTLKMDFLKKIIFSPLGPEKFNNSFYNLQPNYRTKVIV